MEKQLDELQKKLDEQEDKQNKMYLHMYTKGQEAERLAHSDKVMQFALSHTNHQNCYINIWNNRIQFQVLEYAQQGPSRVSVPELIQQLQVTQNELDNLRVWNLASPYLTINLYKIISIGQSHAQCGVQSIYAYITYAMSISLL